VVVSSLITPAEAVLRRAQAAADRLPVPVDLEWLITGRAALRGLTSRGRTSAGGTCRLLPTADGWVAVNLPRASDLEAIPAVVEAAVDRTDPWPAIERFASTRRSADVAARHQLLGIAAAALDDPTVHAADAVVHHEVGEPGRRGSAPLVVDLSSMWAGPLCAHLLGRCGSRVVKVESTERPDGARRGDPELFEWLHEGHEQVTLPFAEPDGRAELRALVEAADVVIESSRPRALAQLGFDAAEIVAARPGRIWVSITGYGRSGDAAGRIAFGDDAAVAGGLVARDDRHRPVFCGDAIADPLSGLFAAAAASEAIRDGGGRLVEVAMAGVAKSVADRP
jgi:CoA-transferase family III